MFSLPAGFDRKAAWEDRAFWRYMRKMEEATSLAEKARTPRQHKHALDLMDKATREYDEKLEEIEKMQLCQSPYNR